MIRADGLRQHLARDGTPPVVVALGPETFLREQVAREVAGAVLGDASSPDVVTVQAVGGSAEADREALDRFFDEARTLSLFAGKKVVVLRGAGPAAGRFKKDFVGWLANPSREIHAVLLADMLPKPVEDAARQHALVVECGGGRRGGREPPPSFVVRRMHERGKRIGRGEAEMLVGLLGDDLTALENAVEILSLYVGEAEDVQPAAIESLFRGAREGSIWAFGDHLLEGKVAAAMVEASRCYAEGIPDFAGSRRVTRGEPAVTMRLLSAFTNSVTRALSVRAQLDSGVPRREIRFGTGRPPPRAVQEHTIRVASQRGRRALESLLFRAEETDRSIKSGGVNGRIAIARLALAAGAVR